MVSHDLPPAPLIGPRLYPDEDPRSNELADNPAQIDVGGQVSSKIGGEYLGGIYSGDGLVDTPGDTT